MYVAKYTYGDAKDLILDFAHRGVAPPDFMMPMLRWVYDCMVNGAKERESDGGMPKTLHFARYDIGWYRWRTEGDAAVK
jgi:hypothetical protein